MELDRKIAAGHHGACLAAGRFARMVGVRDEVVGRFRSLVDGQEFESSGDVLPVGRENLVVLLRLAHRLIGMGVHAHAGALLDLIDIIAKEPLTPDVMRTIRTLWVEPEGLALWGLPYGFRNGQTPGHLFALMQAGGRKTWMADWVRLGGPAHYADMDAEDVRLIGPWLETVVMMGRTVPTQPGQFASLDGDRDAEL